MKLKTFFIMTKIRKNCNNINYIVQTKILMIIF